MIGGNEFKKMSSGRRKTIGILAAKVMFLVLMVSSIVLIAPASAAKPSQGLPSSVDDDSVLQASLSYLQEQAPEWGIKNANDEFRLRSIFRDQLDQIHVRLDQVYKGIPVFGQQLIVHLNSDGTPKSITGVYRAGIEISTQPGITNQDAQERAAKHFPGAFTNKKSELMLYPGDKDIVLVYRVALDDNATPRRIVVFINARTGDQVHSYNDLRTPVPLAKAASGQGSAAVPASSSIELTQGKASAEIGTGYSLYSGTVGITTTKSRNKYSMIDSTRGNLNTRDMNNLFAGKGTVFTDKDNIWGGLSNTDRATAGVDAHYGAEMTWDYYKTNHNRNGIFNDGQGTSSRVHYSWNYNNAFWDDSCKCMTYGDGDGSTFSPLVSLDVAGHEMTHGVTSATADLIYEKQSGGLNEAMSDIFATMVEFYAVTKGAATTPDYMIGEDIFTPGIPGDALRYMDNPTNDDGSIDNFANYYDGLDVHYSSGIANKAFYLLAEDGVIGIGREKAEKIFYRALTSYMIPSETFSQARADTVRAATDLYGAGSQEATSVGNAWSAVGVY